MGNLTVIKGVGSALPDLPISTSFGKARLSAYRGHKLVIYFYPKDDTPGCTLEGQDFSKRHKDFLAAKTQVVGVSRDSLASHEKFCSKYGLSINLVSDTDEALCKAFDVIKEKNMYGKKVLGIERSTFLVDAKGIIRRQWRGVKVAGHVDEVLQAALEL